jgi:hypothetical protein
MGHRLFANLSFASRAQPPAQERAEPRLLPGDPPLPFRRPAQPDPGILSAARDTARPSAVTPIIAVPDRQPVAPLRQESSSLRFAALVGCVLFAAAGVGSAAFLLLANPNKELTAIPLPANPPASRQTEQAVGSVAGGGADKHPAGMTTVPSPPSVSPHPAANDATLQSPSGLPLASPAAPTNAPPTAATASAKPPTATAPAAAAGAAARPAIAAAENPADHPSISAAAEMHRAARAHHAERRAHLRAARETRNSSAQPDPDRFSPRRRSVRVAGPAAPPQADQSSAFNKLIAHLTGSAEPADSPPGQSLTPPAAGAPDPFAARPADGSTHQ